MFGFGEEGLDEFLDFMAVDGLLDRDGVVLQYADEGLLNEGAVDLFGMEEEQVHPPGQIDTVVLISAGDLLQQAIRYLKYLYNLIPDRLILRWLTIPLYLLERLKQQVDNLY